MFSIKKIFGSFDKSVVGIDIGASSIKVVELKKEGSRAVLKAYGNIALGPYAGGNIGSIKPLSNDKIAEALKDVLREAGITAKNSGVAIPFKSSLVSLIEMPALPDKKLEEMIPIEARKYIPVPISEVTLDWWVVPKGKDEVAVDANVEAKGAPTGEVSAEKIDVLVVSIHNEILNDYNNIVMENTLDASFFEIEMFSAVRALASATNDPILIFDMGARVAKLYIVDQGIIRASHIVNRGSLDITEAIAKQLGADFAEAEKVKRSIASLRDVDKKTVQDIVSVSLDYIWTETKNVILNYERRHQKRIVKVIVTGGGAALPHFAEIAEKNLNIKTEMGDPFSKVTTPSFLSETLRTTGLEFAVAVGIALRKLEELK